MKLSFKSLILASTLACAVNASASLVSLDFSDIGIETGSTTTFSTAGDVWRASDVRIDAPGTMDAIFTITGASGVSSSNLYFLDNVARGNNMRVIIANVTSATVFITISLVNAGTSDPYTGWSIGETLISQFSDLDSDAGANRSDFAGARTSEFVDAQTSDNVTANSSLLDLFTGPSYAPDYTVGILQTPWTAQGNVVSTSQAAQSPVTAAFSYDARNSIDIVLGQRSADGINATRHIDIDMTPDFTIIPEPTTALLGGLGMLALLRRRR